MYKVTPSASSRLGSRAREGSSPRPLPMLDPAVLRHACCAAASPTTSSVPLSSPLQIQLRVIPCKRKRIQKALCITRMDVRHLLPSSPESPLNLTMCGCATQGSKIWDKKRKETNLFLNQTWLTST